MGYSPWDGRKSDMTEQLNNNRKDKGPAGQPQFTCPHTRPFRRWDSAPPRSSPQRGSPDPHPVGPGNSSHPTAFLRARTWSHLPLDNALPPLVSTPLTPRELSLKGGSHRGRMYSLPPLFSINLHIAEAEVSYFFQ